MPISHLEIPSYAEMLVQRLCREYGYADWRGFFRQITAAYATPVRYHHTFEGHIAKCLRDFRRIEKYLSDPDALVMELLLHDGVMDYARADNDDRSAEWGQGLLRQIGAPESFCAKVAAGIRAHTHQAMPDSQDGRYGLDIDLTILGAWRGEFWQYEQNIRKEYSFVPEETFRMRRAQILQKFLERPAIYYTEFFHSRYEQRARRNLRWSIDKLTGK